MGGVSSSCFSPWVSAWLFRNTTSFERACKFFLNQTNYFGSVFQVWDHFTNSFVFHLLYLNVCYLVLTEITSDAHIFLAERAWGWGKADYNSLVVPIAGILSLSYKCGNWGSETFNNLPSVVTQLITAPSWIWTPFCLPPKFLLVCPTA